MGGSLSTAIMGRRTISDMRANSHQSAFMRYAEIPSLLLKWYANDSLMIDFDEKFGNSKGVW